MGFWPRIFNLNLEQALCEPASSDFSLFA
jgi:hypothetical protein